MAAAGFSLKKIKTNPTLGQKLKRARKKRKISLTEAEIETKIRSKFLESLENDDWINLPADAYTKGFVMRYARFLGLSEQESYDQYKRERSVFQSKSNDFLMPKKSVKEFKFIITPKFFVPALVALFVIGIFSYIIYQVYGFAAAPELAIVSPNNNSILETEDIEIRGITSQNANVSVNEQMVSVSSDGKFITDYKLQNGINVIQIKAMNKANKEKTLTYTVEYKPKTALVPPYAAEALRGKQDASSKIQDTNI